MISHVPSNLITSIEALATRQEACSKYMIEEPWVITVALMSNINNVRIAKEMLTKIHEFNHIPKYEAQCTATLATVCSIINIYHAGALSVGIDCGNEKSVIEHISSKLKKLASSRISEFIFRQGLNSKIYFNKPAQAKSDLLSFLDTCGL